jgi:hypothetical protein
MAIPGAASHAFKREGSHEPVAFVSWLEKKITRLAERVAHRWKERFHGDAA